MIRLNKTELGYFAILFVILAAIFILNWAAPSSITSPRHLAVDLSAPPDQPQAWSVQYWIPTKYRALYRWIVQGTFALLFAPNDAFGFYLTFIFWGYAFFCCTLVAFYYFLRALDFNAQMAFVGCLAFLASPPVTLAYKYPVFTREDPLAYFLVLLGLLGVFKRKPVWVSVIAVLAALTRETTLIIPLTYLLAARDSWHNKILVCLPPVIAAIGIRFLLGYASYNPFEGSIYNFETPWQSLAFIFCIFGALWLPFAAQLRAQWHTRQTAGEAWRIIISTAPIVFLIVFGTHIVFARAREIRISFLMFPWIISLALAWFDTKRARLTLLFSKPMSWVWLSGVLGSLFALTLFASLAIPDTLKLYLADFKNGYWLGISNLHLWITLAVVLPILVIQRREQATQLGR